MAAKRYAWSYDRRAKRYHRPADSRRGSAYAYVAACNTDTPMDRVAVWHPTHLTACPKCFKEKEE